MFCTYPAYPSNTLENVSIAELCSYCVVCRAQKQLPKSLDVFGWCTWDAFYWQVSAKGILNGLQSLHDGGVPPKLLVIDDGQCSLINAMPLYLLPHSAVPFSLPFHQCVPSGPPFHVMWSAFWVHCLKWLC